MPKRAPQPLSFALACLALLLLPAAAAIAAEWPTLRAGSELDFRPYCFTDANGQPSGLGPDLLKAVADKMGLRLQLTAAPWDAQWDKLVAGQLDVLPVVARTPGREPLVDFSLPHTETFDAFFVRKGQPPIHNIASAAGKSIVVLRQDAAHHQLTERKFAGQIIPVDSIPEGLRLVAAGKHDALLCSKLIGTLECRQAGIKGVVSGPLIGDYKRTFSFAVPKGRTELLEKLNQGLLLVKTDGTYDQIYRRWLAVEEPWHRWVPYLRWAVALAAVLTALVIALQALVRRRTRQLRQLTATLEQRVAQRTAELSESQARYRTLLDVLPTAVYTCDAEGHITFFNERAAELWGRRPRLNDTDERFCGAFRLWLPDGQPLPHAQTPMARAIRDGASCRDQEVIIEHPDGRPVHVLVNIDPLRDAAGRITGAVNAFTDITARKQAEEALRASEERIQQALHVSRSFTFQWEPATDEVRRSDSCERILGLSGQAAMHDTARRFFQRIHPGDRDRFTAILRDLTPAADSYNTQYRVVRDDRTIIVLEEIGRAAFDPAGKLLCLVGVATDITERKIAEEALRASEERFRLTLKNSPVLVTMQDANLVYQWVYNTKTRRPEECIGRTDADLFLADEAAAVMAAKRRVLETGAEVRQAFWLTSNGQRVFLDCNFEPVRDANGKIIGVRGASVNLTEQKRAEEALAAAHRRTQDLIDNAGAIIYACDLEERFVLANAALATVLNTTVAQLIGRRRHEFMPQADADAHEANDRCAIEAGHAIQFEEHSDLHGRSITWLTTKFPLRDAVGRIYGVAGIVTDISQRKEMEQALRSAKADLEHANSAKDAFIAKLSHELRTPLTPVVASLSAIARDPRLPENLREDMALLQRNIGLQVLLINDLLDVTRIVSGKLELRQQPVNVADIVHDVGRMLATDLEARAQRLVVSAPEPCWVRADASRLHQVFWNLVKNAIKFSPDHGQITVEMRSDATHTHIAVRDHGRGIDAADLPRLFRAFEQGASAHGFGGLGLGLAICRGIIEMHGGTIAAASQGLGHGATFTVTLPTCAAPADAAVPGAPRPAVVDSRALRILLVEDHADTARMMTRLLQAEGHTVTCAPDVAAGVTAALTGDFHVLMSDLSLPDGTGYDLMRRITAAGKHLRGIAVSGHGSPADVQRSLEAGFIEHITKPVHFDALQQALLRVAAGATAHTSDRSSAHHAGTG